jgi:hypothetical protein
MNMRGLGRGELPRGSDLVLQLLLVCSHTNGNGNGSGGEHVRIRLQRSYISVATVVMLQMFLTIGKGRDNLALEETIDLSRSRKNSWAGRFDPSEVIWNAHNSARLGQ